MKTTSVRSFFNRPLSARWKQILIAAFLSFGMAIPEAHAKCFRDFTQAVKTPEISAAVAAPVNPATTDAFLGLNLSPGIVGLWNVTFSSGGEIVDVAFDAWHSDGTEILNDYTNPIEGNVCLGVWEQTGPRSFRLKHPSWAFDTNGTLLGTVVIRENVTLSPDSNSYKGTYRYDIYDTTGAFVTELTGTLSATRIRPD
jgi:hypothetical protein